MKSDRLLSALLLLQAHGRLTGRELAERLEVSERTVHRDMESLSAAGVPISALRGAQGGWQLEPGWRTQVPGLDAAELNALLMAQPRALGDPRLAAAAERAFEKLMAAFSAPMRARAAAIRERLYIDATGWHPSNENLSLLADVQEAVARDCKISFDYTRADGQSGPRTVDPLGLVAKGASWYLVARAPAGLRTYRVSRMRNLTPLTLPCERPPNFDLAAYWKHSTAQLEQQRRQYETILMFDPRSAHSALEWFAVTPIEEGSDSDEQNSSDSQKFPAKEGWKKFLVRFDNEDQAAFIALGYGTRIQVISPPELKRRVAAETQALAAREA